MKLIHKDFRKGIVKVHIQNMGDLWYLSHVIDEGDLISGKTQRKIKMGAEGDRTQKTVVKKVFLKIQAEKIEFHKYSDKLSDFISQHSTNTAETLEFLASVML